MKRKKILQHIGYALLIAAIAAVLEVCAFNFKPITTSLGWRQDETRVFTSEDIAADSFVNCFVNADGRIEIAAEGASFTIGGLNMELNTLRAEFEAEGVSSLTAFCDADKEDKTVTLYDGAMNVVVDGTIHSVRIDLNGEVGGTIGNIRLIVNNYQFQFSWARFIAMIVVGIVTRALFALQRPIDYGIDTSAAVKKEENGVGQA